MIPAPSEIVGPFAGAAFGLQQRRHVLHRHGFRSASHLKRGIGTYGLGGLDDEAGADELLESGGGDIELVSAGRKLGDGVVARAGSGYRVYGGGFGVPGFDGGGGTTAPAGSDTVPVIVPRLLWAIKGAVQTKSKATATLRRVLSPCAMPQA